MTQLKLSKADGYALQTAVESMAAAALEENRHKKARDAAKVIILRELFNRRALVVDSLKAGELVIVQVEGADVLKIERKAAQRLDQEALGAAHPDIVAQFTKPSVASYFSSLLK